jgi:H+/Cl- antiporter ClcA
LLLADSRALKEVFAAITLFVAKPEQPSWWDPSAYWVAFLAILLSMLAYVNSRSSVQWFRRLWQRAVFELLLFALVVASIVVFSTRTQTSVQQLSQQVQKLQDAVSATRANPTTAPVQRAPSGK